MKKKFRALLSFLRAYRKESINFSWTYYTDSEPEWEWTYSEIKEIPKNIQYIAAEIAEKFWEEVWEESPESETEYYRILLTVFPTQKKALLRCNYEVYNDQDDTYSVDINAGEILEFLQKNNVEEITAEYDGYSDSGEIQSLYIDEKPIPDYWNNPDRTYKVVWDVLYDKLENAFGGWEIDDGSSGEIKIFKPYDDNYVLDISHTWRMREMRESDYKKEITENSFEE